MIAKEVLIISFLFLYLSYYFGISADTISFILLSIVGLIEGVIESVDKDLSPHIADDGQGGAYILFSIFSLYLLLLDY